MNDISTQNTPIQNQGNKLNFEFRGDGMEYFKIWIVNVLLSVITLGIYSAWATVRNNRYFHSNLYLDNTNFRYLAEPMAILKGRLIAIGAFILLSVVAQLFPLVGAALHIGLIFTMPYFVNMSLAFSHRMSSYNNIQFRFKASYGEAFMALFVWPLLGLISLGILYPLAFVKMNQYVVNNSSYGTSKFAFNASYKDYGVIFLTMIGVGLVLGLPAWAVGFYLPSLAFISPIFMGFVYLGLFLYFTVQTTGLFYRSTTLLDHGFEANLTMQGLAKVILINVLLTIVTAGLYLPAAKVRMTKYMCSCIKMNATGSLDNFAAAEKENISALGEEFGQVFDFAM